MRAAPAIIGIQKGTKEEIGKKRLRAATATVRFIMLLAVLIQVFSWLEPIRFFFA